MDETKRLVQKCYELDYYSLSVEEIDRVRYLFLDYLGVAARGSLYDSSRPPQNLARTFGADSGGAVVIGTRRIQAQPKMGSSPESKSPSTK